MNSKAKSSIKLSAFIMHDDDSGDESSNENGSVTSSNLMTDDDVKTELAKQLLDQFASKRPDKTSYTNGLKKIDWTKIHVPGTDVEELKQALGEIVKSVRKMRTLEDILEDYEENHFTYQRAAHPDKPKAPTQPHLTFISANRQKIEEELQRNNPNDKIKYFDVVKAGNEKYKSLSPEKKEKYINDYKEAMIEYKEKMEEFYIKHSELKPVKNKKPKAGKTTGPSADPSVISPFQYYYDSVKMTGTSRLDAMSDWRNMPAKEKGKLLMELNELDTNVTKKFSKDDYKAMELYMGYPEKPLMPYNIFVRGFRDTYTGGTSGFMAAAGGAWKNVPNVDKAKLQNIYETDMKKWRNDVNAKIATLPRDQQAIMRDKFKVFPQTGTVDARKRKATSTSTGTNNANNNNKRLRFLSDSDDDEVKMKKPGTSKKFVMHSADDDSD